MRILITGGAGCLGANLVAEYLAQGHEILVIDNFATGSPETLAAQPRLEVVVGSVADRDLVDAAFARFAPTHVIHSAASYKDPNDWREDASTNVTRHDQRCRGGTARGRQAVCLFPDGAVLRPAGARADTGRASTRPFTSYGISKTAGEAYLAISDLPWVSLRLANVTGPRLAIGPIPTFYKRLKSRTKMLLHRQRSAIFSTSPISSR